MMDTPRASQSEALYRRALKVMPGGVSRNTVLRKPHPLYAAHASGCRITDVEGVERIDFANNMASLIHGHSHPAIIAAVTKQLRRGTAHTLATEVELRLAEHLCERVDSLEQIRFVNSGTEAVMAAIKVARAFTGRPKIAKAEGTYHGTYDYAEVSQTSTPCRWGPLADPVSVPVAEGTPPSVLDDVVVVPFNDTDLTLRILNRHADDIACVLLDVMPHRAGLCSAEPEYVAALRDWATRNSALLVADEVVTFRNSHGGAQQHYGLTPDLTALGKIIGGGFPVGAVGGRAEVMSVMNPHGDRYVMPHSGTFSANPITLTAGLVAMEMLDLDEVQRLNRLGQLAREGIVDVIDRRGIDASVTGEGSMFRIHMQPAPPRHYRETYPNPEQATQLKQFFDALLDAGILLIYSCTGAVSTPMRETEIDQLVAAVDTAFQHSHTGIQETQTT
ncbi:MAG: aspartate aminotransferase family protein [Acidimicrobiaceae bacterium]|nr:aspartate aminotransferase family protein [Acidimicrobiaceae bacterium]MDE0516906.1 aspartate aminotransferase family protein [Acidimicrobiaceae bacterium]MDE0657910.1 aspartate aminotransferase family protein [Acidimicrobiaceae bacterium]